MSEERCARPDSINSNNVLISREDNLNSDYYKCKPEKAPCSPKPPCWHKDRLCIGPCPPGPQGPEGPEGPEGPGGTTVYLASDQSISNGHYLGLGTSESEFLRTTIVIPHDSTIAGLVLNVRDQTLGPNDTVTAEIVRSTDCGQTLMDTGVRATVTGPNPPNCCMAVTADYDVELCDLLAVRITRTGNTGALSNGAAATILMDLQ